MANVTAFEGVGTIEHQLGKFVGATAPGEYPAVGHVYRIFSFTPKPGTRGVLVFEPENYVERNARKYYSFWHNGDRLVVYEGLKTGTRFGFRAHAQTHDGMLVAPFRDWNYVTFEPKDDKQNYKVVDLMEMLRYISGDIDLKELDRHARARVRRVVHVQNYKEFRNRVAEDREARLREATKLLLYFAWYLAESRKVQNTLQALKELRGVPKWLLFGARSPVEQIDHLCQAHDLGLLGGLQASHFESIRDALKLVDVDLQGFAAPGEDVTTRGEFISAARRLVDDKSARTHGNDQMIQIVGSLLEVLEEPS